MKKIQLPYFLIATLAAMLWLPWLLAKGMFMDGLCDAVLSQNLAHGISTFWAPQIYDFSNPAYWDNPPLSMFTLSICYKLFGYNYVVERVYSLSCVFIQLLLIVWAWKIIWHNDRETAKYAWLPCLLFLISPLTGWCYSNNLMENTMSVFTTLSIICYLLYTRNNKYVELWSLAGGTLIFLAFITKGPVALFPLVFPVLLMWRDRKYPAERMWHYAFLQFVVLILAFTAVFSQPAPGNFAEQYYIHQLLPALGQPQNVQTNGFLIYKELLIALLPLLLLASATFFIVKKEEMHLEKFNLNKGVRFILMGLAASLPIALSMKQRKFYLLPSLPVFAIGFSFFILPLPAFLEKRFTNFFTEIISMAVKIICGMTVLGCVMLTLYNEGGYVRDEVMLKDLEAMLSLTKGEEAICADWQFYSDWALRAYSVHYYSKKVYMPDRVSETKFYMTKPGHRGDKLWPNALKIYSCNTFDLYKL